MFHRCFIRGLPLLISTNLSYTLTATVFNRGPGDYKPADAKRQFIVTFPGSTGNGDNGTLFGSPTYVAGKYGAQAISLNGTSQYLLVPSTSAANILGVNNWTVSAWVNLAASPNGNANGIQGTRFPSNNNAYDFKCGNTQIHSDIGPGNTTSWLTTGADAGGLTINSGTWYLVTETVTSGGSYADYLNGNLAASGTFSGTPVFMMSGGPMGVGNDYAGGTYVEQGTLYVQNSGAIQDGASLSIGAGGGFIFDPTVTGSALDATLMHAVPQINPVPEPGTLVLLSVAGIVVAAAAWRKRRK